MLYPQNGLAAMLRRHPDRAADVHALLGQVTGHELRGEGRVYGGGLNKIEPSELARISAAAFSIAGRRSGPMSSRRENSSAKPWGKGTRVG